MFYTNNNRERTEGNFSKPLLLTNLSKFTFLLQKSTPFSNTHYKLKYYHSIQTVSYGKYIRPFPKPCYLLFNIIMEMTL